MSDISATSGYPAQPPVVAAPVLSSAPLLANNPDTLLRTAAHKRMEVRIWCGFVFLMCVAMLSVAHFLTPDGRGMETHRQLGLPPCGFYLTTGLPCPTCGCTTAVSRFAHGQLLASFLTQPFGFLVGLLAVILVPLTAIGIVAGRWLGPSMFTLNWYWRLWLFGGMGWIAGAWIYKILIVKSGFAIP
jgi:hypothetical protein